VAVHLLAKSQKSHSKLRCPDFRAAAIALALLLAPHVSVAKQGMHEIDLKAAFVLRFAAFVTWPSDSYASPGAPLRIGVLGDAALADSLGEQSEGKQIQGRSTIVRILDGAASSISDLDILYIGSVEHNQSLELRRRAAQLPILTVGAREGFAETGGMIELERRDSKLRFFINRQAARSAGLEISSKLLKLARKVY
jgi:hypothetical protein